MEKKPISEKGLFTSGPQQLFIASVLSMSWQLAIVFLVPVIAGIELDKHLKTTPILTLIGFVVAIAGGCLVVAKAVKTLNHMASESVIPEKKEHRT